MVQFINKSEEFVYKVCCSSFLSLWSYANPQGKDAGKELCDVLIVCDPHIIIISVKDIAFKKSSDPDTETSRWYEKAIASSVRQLYGAERHISGISQVVKCDGSLGFPLPKLEHRITHKIAVACGGNGEVSIPSGDFGKGYVHVLTENAFMQIMNELDTITDLNQYFTALENSNMKIMVDGGTAADILAFYITEGRKFPEDVASILIMGGMWDAYISRPEVKNKAIANKVSYSWDKLIELVAKDLIDDAIEPVNSKSVTELALRTMALEDRFSRRVLGQVLKKFFETPDLRARITSSPKDITYMLMQATYEGNHDQIAAELEGRCFLARGLQINNKIVIGIAILTDSIEQKQRIMLCRLFIPEWTKQDQKEFEIIQSATRGFQYPHLHHYHVDEFPENLDD